MNLNCIALRSNGIRRPIALDVQRADVDVAIEHLVDEHVRAHLGIRIIAAWRVRNPLVVDPRVGIEVWIHRRPRDIGADGGLDESALGVVGAAEDAGVRGGRRTAQIAVRHLPVDRSKRELLAADRVIDIGSLPGHDHHQPGLRDELDTVNQAAPVAGAQRDAIDDRLLERVVNDYGGHATKAARTPDIAGVRVDGALACARASVRNNERG